MKQNEIAVTLHTIRNYCQTEKDLIVEQDECIGDPLTSLEISYNNLLKFIS